MDVSSRQPTSTCTDITSNHALYALFPLISTDLLTPFIDLVEDALLDQVPPIVVRRTQLIDFRPDAHRHLYDLYLHPWDRNPSSSPPSDL